ncbi:MAG: long-chain fatty acid--CoA ligase [bacterium]
MGRTDTLVHRLANWAETQPDKPALRTMAGEGWSTLTWSEYWTAVREVAKGLIALGHEVGDCVALVGENRPEWVITQMGIMAARGVPAPIYTNNTPEQTAFIVDHSRSKIAVADRAERLTKYREAQAAGLMKVEQLVVMQASDAGDDAISLATLRAKGRDVDDAVLDQRLDELTADETAMLIYTSGTTGVPKGVMLSSGNMLAVADALFERWPVLKEVDYRVVSYLPLCHVAEQAVTTFGLLLKGGEVYFCPDLTKIKDYLLAVHPTIFMAVPRVWEKFQAALEARLAEATGLKAKLASWALRTEGAAFEQELTSGRPANSFGRRMANKLVISKIKTKLGLDQLRLAVSGAAPISEGTLRFFSSLGIVIYEVWGMSETAAVATASQFGRPRPGTVGHALKGVELRIAEDDEVLLKGPGMTSGYLHLPEATAELFDEEGWLHTGDLGALDDEGNLRITGRKKDLLITAGGKNVAPAEMEAYISQIPGVGQVVVVGDRQPCLCALITLDPEGLQGLAAAAGAKAGSLEELAAQAAVREHLMREVETHCNDKVARYQTIKKIRVLPVEFTVDGGEMTPTMKVKRNVINKKYADDIAALYA